MNKKLTQFRWLAATLMLVAAMVMPSTAWAYNQPNGEGTKKSPYQISSGDELYWFAAYVNGDPGEDNGTHTACAVLTQDISVSGEWVPIISFYGNFDGQGHTISGLQKTNEGERVEIGLFTSIESNAEIRNVGIVNCNFIGNSGCQVGGVCGSNNGGTITNCYNTGSVNGEEGSVGGVCGINNGTITNCYNTGSVKNGQGLGGICGINTGTITNCYYLSGTATAGISNNWGTGSAEEKAAAQFANGEVAWLLNGGKTDGSQAWYQALSGEGYPNLNKDTENRTVYGAYKHGETRPTCSNSQSSLSMLHALAYDSSATDEANGNHDMSCVQDENNQYTWTDNEANSNATAKCNFICSVCNSEVAKDMTVTHDEGKTNVPAKCMQEGHNYYVASLTFNGTTYTNYYTQEVPALGHDDSGDVTFNSGNKIYEKVCKREGCGETIYYANAAGKIEATPNAGATEFTVAKYPLQDAKTYDNKAVFTATEFTYTRTFTTTEWTTWYVPFDLTLTSDICAHYDFSRINNVHQYDDDGDGNADRTVVESFRQTAGVKLKANYPYLVRAKSNADFSMSLPLTNVVPALAETNSIDCQSVDYKYTFTGTYAGMGDSGSADTDPYTLCDGNKWLHFHSLSPMRHYLTIVSRNVSLPSTAPMRSIMLSVVGDEGTTGIVKLYDEERKSSETYDLSGRRLPAGSKPRGLIIENGKVTFKK